eukprot:jgi/Tetstr1/465496/TSEL_000880.t1
MAVGRAGTRALLGALCLALLAAPAQCILKRDDRSFRLRINRRRHRGSASGGGSLRMSGDWRAALAMSTNGCSALEVRGAPGTPCQPHPLLTDWCLPKFSNLNSFDLLGRASHYVNHDLGSRRYNYLKRAFRNITVRPSQREAWAQPQYLYNKGNALANRLQRRNFKIYTPASKYPRGDLPSLRNFRTCAVVGSAKVMLGSRAGEAIDAHDVVFRSNQAPTKGFERDVGSRTDFRLVNSANAYASEDGNRTVCLTPVMPKNMGDSVARQVHKRIPRPSEWCTQWTVSPIFEAYRWTTFAHKTRGDAKAKFSSGFSAIVLAVNLCEQVDIYGYTFSGAYYYNKVHNGNFSKKRPSRRPRSRRPGNGAAADPAAGEDGEGGEGEEAEDGEQVLEEGLDPEEMLEEGNAAFDLGQQSEGPGDDQGERRRRRLQGIAKNGHPWNAEKECTTKLARVLPMVRWHQ